MIRSMTGFGRYELEAHDRRISVNHRYLDLSIKMPRSFNAFESKIRNVIRDYVERGKTDIYISCEELGEDRLSLKYNRELAKGYLGYLKEMAEEFGLEADVRVSTLARFPEVFTMEQEEGDEAEAADAQFHGCPACAVDGREGLAHGGKVVDLRVAEQDEEQAV